MLLLLGVLLGGYAHAATAASVAPAPSGVVADRVVAVVNDEVITLTEVYAFTDYIEQAAVTPGGREQAEAQVLELLIERILINDEIKRLKIDVTPQELDWQIDAVARANNMDRDEMRVEIEKTGLTWETYRDELEQSLREQKFGSYVLRPRITITEDEIKDRYLRATNASGASAEAARLQVVFLGFPAGADDAAKDAVRARMAEIRAQAVGGADFASLSAAYDEAGFGARGGEMGSFRPGELMPALDAVVTATATGDVTPAVETEQGIFLVLVAERRGATEGMAEARNEIMEQIFQERLQDEQLRWFEQARRQASIRVLLGDPSAPPPAPLSEEEAAMAVPDQQPADESVWGAPEEAAPAPSDAGDAGPAPAP